VSAGAFSATSVRSCESRGFTWGLLWEAKTLSLLRVPAEVPVFPVESPESFCAKQ